LQQEHAPRRDLAEHDEGEERAGVIARQDFALGREAT
jgi:hypothetical protein